MKKLLNKLNKFCPPSRMGRFLRVEIHDRVNNRGMTLVEVLVTLAVLSIMAVPIFDTFLESMKINHKTMSTVSANHIGQQMLETLKDEKSPEGMVIETSGLPEGIYKRVTDEIDDFTIVATYAAVEDLSYAPDASTSVKLGNEVDTSAPDLKVLYSKLDEEASHFEFSGEEAKTTWTKLRLKDTGTLGSNVTVDLVTMEKTGDDWEEKSSPISPASPLTGTDPIEVVVQVEGLPDKGRIDIQNDTMRDLLVYEVDDKNSLIKVFPKTVASKGTAKLYRNLISNPDSGDNQEVVYNVVVKVSKNGTVLEEFIGTVIE